MDGIGAVPFTAGLLSLSLPLLLSLSLSRNFVTKINFISLGFWLRRRRIASRRRFSSHRASCLWTAPSLNCLYAMGQLHGPLRCCPLTRPPPYKLPPCHALSLSRAFFLANILRFGKMTSFPTVEHKPNAEKFCLNLVLAFFAGLVLSLSSFPEGN